MPIKLARHGGVHLLILNRPEALDALGFAILREGEARVADIEPGIERVSRWRWRRTRAGSHVGPPTRRRG